MTEAWQDDGGEIALRAHGDGPAVVWLHGYTMDSSTWEPLWAQLPGWRHVGIDLPGHGGSAPLRPGCTLAMLGHEIARIAREHQATRMVGVSFGSMVALQVTLDHQDAIHHLVLAAPTIAGAETEPAARDRYLELIRLYRARGPGPDMAELWMRSPPDIFAGTEAHPAVRAQIHDVVVRHRWRELSNGAMRGMTDHAQPPESLRQIRAALLVLVGENDMPTFLANAQMLGEHVRGCDVYQVPGAGHLCPLELPGSVAPRIDAHLRTR